LLGPVAGVGDTGLVLDRLAGMFLLVVSAVAVPALLVVAAWSWRQEAMRTLPAGLCLLLGSSVLVLLARDVFVLVLAWELVTGAFYWLTIPGRHRSDGDGDVNPALATVGFGKVSGAALLLGSLLLAANSGSTSLDHLGSGAHGPARAAGYTLLVVAFAVKVGLAPLQVWMPRGYAAGCGPARALMAGAAVNIGFYGLWRTLQVLGAPPGWLAVTVLLLGGMTALLGIAHATVQTRLTGVVAYSSVENAGLIAVAYAVAMLGAITGKPQLLAAGLLAATLQVIAHAVGKTLLFASAGFIESRLGTDDIEALRGVARRLPWSGTGLAVGALMMAGLPPMALFVSEWFILETLMQQFRLGQLNYALPMAGAGALVALDGRLCRGGVRPARRLHRSWTHLRAPPSCAGRGGCRQGWAGRPHAGLFRACRPDTAGGPADRFGSVRSGAATHHGCSRGLTLGARAGLPGLLRPVPDLAGDRSCR